VTRTRCAFAPVVVYVPLMRAYVEGAALGAVAGFLAGLFGIGGGVIIVPGLVLWLRLTQYEASGTAVATIVASSAAALVLFAADGKVDWFAAFALFVGSGAGAWIGGRLIERIPEHVLAGGFALVLLIAGVRLWL